jgi:long-chain acyl-CoA synthetase
MQKVLGDTMERFWLKNYPAGVPHDVDYNQYTSIAQLIEEAFAKYRNRKAYVCMDKTIRFGEVDDLSKALAAYFQAKGLQKGDRIALMMPNVLQYPVAIAAVLRAGYVVVNVRRESLSISSKIPALKPS